MKFCWNILWNYFFLDFFLDEDVVEEVMSCFFEDVIVCLEGGWIKKMKELWVGDKVVGLDSVIGCVVYSWVMMFFDIKLNSLNIFIIIWIKILVVEVVIMEFYLIY